MEWKILWDMTIEERKEMREGLEARIKDLTRLLQEP